MITSLPHVYGKYKLLERIGVGGMAEVFRAMMPGVAGFEKIIVIKRILPHLTNDASFTRMFITEAKLAARVQHKNIVQVFELGEVDGELYIAMEYVDGLDLRVLLRAAAERRKKIPIWFSLHVVSEMLSGLAHAHELTDERGRPLQVVHRDVTPSNVFIAKTGDVKIGDFGIAKSANMKGTTRAGQLKGKVAYMPPEQILNEEIDGRADVFASAVVLWECLTQRRLFGARSEFETMREICDGTRTAPSKYNREIPPELDDIVLSALNVFPERRPASAQDFQRALLEILPRFRKSIMPVDIRGVVSALTAVDGDAPALGVTRAGSQIGGANDFADTSSLETPAASDFDLKDLAQKRRALRHSNPVEPPKRPAGRPASGWQKVLGDEALTEPVAPADDPPPPSRHEAARGLSLPGALPPAEPRPSSKLKLPPARGDEGPTLALPRSSVPPRPNGPPTPRELELSAAERQAPTMESGMSIVKTIAPFALILMILVAGTGYFVARAKSVASASPDAATDWKPIGWKEKPKKPRKEPVEAAKPEPPEPPPSLPPSPDRPAKATPEPPADEPEDDDEPEAADNNDSNEPGTPVNLVSIFSQPSGATVEIDGNPIGSTPLVMPHDFAPGREVDLTLTVPGYKPWTERVQVNEAGSLSVTATLEKEDSPR